MEAQLHQQQQGPSPILASGIKFVAGLFFTALGVLLTLDNLDLIHAEKILRFWPLVFIAVGIVELVRGGSQLFAGLAIVAGAFLLAATTRWFRVSVFDLWPLVLVGAGVFIVAQALGLRAPARPAGADASNVWAVLSHRKVISSAADYRGGRIVAFMGGCDLDLTQADVQSGAAVIDVVAFWGGIAIRVPEGWDVSCEAVPVMGGVEVKTKGSPGGRRLIIRGLTLMGGMEVKSVPRRSE